MEYEAVWERVKDITGWKTQNDMAEYLNIKQGSVSGAKKRGVFPIEWAFKIAQGFNSSTDWILTGKEQHKQIDFLGLWGDKEYRKQESLAKMITAEFSLVPRYDVKASAGPGSYVASEQIVDHLAFKRQWIKDMGLNDGKLALIMAKGDSMEPTIKDGSLLLVDLREGFPGSNGIYILRLNGELIAKRIQMMVGGDIKIKSDNPKYDEQCLSHNEAEISLKVIGKVVWGGGKM